EKFRFLRVGLAIVLTFIGVKMLVTAVGFHIPIQISLIFVALVLAGSIVVSLLFPSDQPSSIKVDLDLEADK
ncbi:MAG TPA: hypothetical protein VJS17_00625, partial [Pyrinomonadaceae bacterium]|nr:hypothetical protein [Pyrinomonadaceae bacterium]